MSTRPDEAPAGSAAFELVMVALALGLSLVLTAVAFSLPDSAIDVLIAVTGKDAP